MLDGSADTVRRFAPPSQRNRVLNRRKSEKNEKINSYGIDEEKSGSSYSKTFPAMDRNNIQNENARPGLIPIDGCCRSEAVQLLNERWAAAMHSFNDPSIDLLDWGMPNRIDISRYCRLCFIQAWTSLKTDYVFWSYWIFMGLPKASSPDGLPRRTPLGNASCPKQCSTADCQ
ncbi:uncharacterized protein M6B38_409040 [Iris pallida]|uniref:Uncharacterized protein n=1 Tax=Iris pallida TaxID=29817 RepID=A0AAX6FN39_IRIPA|nr:uncharacterized protein M6B38_409040 [Iris pallida]